jgi:hypothetical protein
MMMLARRIVSRSRIYLAIIFASMVLGIETLNAVPGIAFLLVLVGWVSKTRFARVAQKAAQGDRVTRIWLAGNML